MGPMMLASWVERLGARGRRQENISCLGKTSLAQGVALALTRIQHRGTAPPWAASRALEIVEGTLPGAVPTHTLGAGIDWGGGAQAEAKETGGCLCLGHQPLFC